LRRLILLEIVLIYLVVLAGSIVRMTGSGMGCPDWPKCFGHLIPPTEESQIRWKANTEFKKAQMIIYNEKLLQAKSSFVSGISFEGNQWEEYTKHDYAIFNPFHTWIEYINRLLGALSGIPMFILFIIGIYNIRRRFKFFILSALGLILLGFEAWLGKLVVDGNLVPGQISLHMFGALAIISVLVIMLSMYSKRASLSKPNALYILPTILFLLLIQVFLGTQVREEVDLMTHGLERDSWIDNLSDLFIIHRSFSWLLFISSALFLFLNRNSVSRTTFMPLLFCLGNISVGIGIAYFGFPKALQPIHLMLACLFYGWVLYSWLGALNKKRTSFTR